MYASALGQLVAFKLAPSHKSFLQDRIATLPHGHNYYEYYCIEEQSNFSHVTFSFIVNYNLAKANKLDKSYHCTL